MNRILSSKYVKLYFGTLLLKPYRLLSFPEVKEIIDNTVEKYENGLLHLFLLF